MWIPIILCNSTPQAGIIHESLLVMISPAALPTKWREEQCAKKKWFKSVWQRRKVHSSISKIIIEWKTQLQNHSSLFQVLFSLQQKDRFLLDVAWWAQHPLTSFLIVFMSGNSLEKKTGCREDIWPLPFEIKYPNPHFNTSREAMLSSRCQLASSLLLS